MDYTIPAGPFVLCMLAGMLACLNAGRYLGKRKLATDPEGALEGISVLDGAVFGLYGLLIAFTFSGAPARLDARRQLAVEEANALGTAYLRLDLLPAGSQPALREKFRLYADSRIETYRKLPDVEAAKASVARSVELQNEIWKDTIAATRLPDSHPDAAKTLVPALNAMIDITTTRTQSHRMHPPWIIFALLFVLSLVSSLLAGYGMAGRKQRSWLHIIAFAVFTVVTIFVVLEIEFPRRSVIGMDEFDHVLVDAREAMK